MIDGQGLYVQQMNTANKEGSENMHNMCTAGRSRHSYTRFIRRQLFIGASFEDVMESEFTRKGNKERTIP